MKGRERLRNTAVPRVREDLVGFLYVGYERRCYVEGGQGGSRDRQPFSGPALTKFTGEPVTYANALQTKPHSPFSPLSSLPSWSRNIPTRITSKSALNVSKVAISCRFFLSAERQLWEKASTPQS